MIFVLQCVRFAAIFFMLTPVIFGVRLAVWPVAMFSERKDRALKRVLMRWWYTGTLAILGVRVVRLGAPPAPPFFLVANHLSYVDMLVLGRETDCLFVSRGDIEHWPVIGFMIKSFYMLFIDRQSKRDTARVNKLIAHALEMGEGIAIFPESRISCGLSLLPFKSALIQPALDNQQPVHYATLHYQSPPGAPPANKVVLWWRPEPFFAHLFRLMKYPGVTATVRFGEAPLAGVDRKELAARLWDAVNEHFVPME